MRAAQLIVIVGVMLAVTIATFFIPEPVVHTRDETYAVKYEKRCDDVASAFMNSKQGAVMSKGRMLEMFEAIQECQDHKKLTLPQNSKGGFNGWIPNVFKSGNNNEGQ